MMRVTNLTKHYPLRGGKVHALDGVSFELNPGKTLAVVGESGCGKSTLAKVLMRIESATSGTVQLAGIDTGEVPRKDFIRQMQMVFQDPYSSLNPRKKVWQIVTEPLRVQGGKKSSKGEWVEAARRTLDQVGLRPEFAERYPHMLSGGQRQRLGIARALALEPSILICDEPVSACDVSIQSKILNLLLDLQERRNLAYLFISHDLAIVRHLADDVMVLYLGKIVEKGARAQIFHNPLHPCTRALLGSSPSISRGTPVHPPVVLSGELSSPLNPPPGCGLSGRCPFAVDRCRSESPALLEQAGRFVACHLATI